MKLLKGVTVSIIISLLCFVAPFNIYADTLPQSEIVGVTYNKIDETVSYLNGSGTWVYVYEIEVLLKNKYVGVVDGTLSYSYSEVPSGQTITKSKRTYVNGDSFKLNVSITQFGSSYSGSAPMYSASFLVNAQNTNVTKYEDLTSIDSIVSLLQDIYTNSGDIENLSTNQLAELEKIVQNTSLANQYLETISKLRQYNFPLESFNAVSYMFDKFEIVDYVQYGSWTYPLFEVPANSTIGVLWYYSGNYDIERYFIVLGKFHANSNPFTYQNANFLRREEYFYNESYGLWKYIYKGLSTGSNFSYIVTNRDLVLCPIYNALKTINNISTDFALRFGLSNQLLDDIHTIAQGTSSSNQQSSDLSSGTDSMQQQMNSFTTQEDSYNQQMNNSINAIDFTSPVSQNAGILPAANFVISIFNGLIQNNAFSVLIIIVCVLIIGKKVIGK